MTVLSLVAVGRLAERHIRQATEPVLATALVSWFEHMNVDAERAQAGIRLAVIGARLEQTEVDGRPAVQLAAPSAGCGMTHEED